MVVTQRALVRYRAYLVVMYYTQKWRAEPPVATPGPVSPRVSVEDYLANMERFRAEADRRGIAIAFLTRPHKLPPEELSKNSTWRGSVPKYNAALRAWGREQGVPVIDAQHYFEQLPTDLFSDECHFTPQGYERMARLVRDELDAGRHGSQGSTERRQASGQDRRRSQQR